MEPLAAILNRATEHHLAGRLDQAEADYRLIISQSPGNAPAWHGLGVLATQLGRFREAVPLLTRAVELDPVEHSFRHNLGKTFSSLNEHELARQQLEVVVRMQPNIADAWNDLGNSYRGLKLQHQAIEAYHTAIKVQSDFALAYFNLGTCYRDLNDLIRAIDSFQKAIRLAPGFSQAFLDLGCVYSDLGEITLAVEAFRSALRTRPNWTDALTNLGNALQQCGLTEQAIQIYQQSLSIDPSVAETHYNLGNLFLSTRQLSSAEAAYSQAFQLRPDYVIAATSLVHVRQQLGLWDGTNELAQYVIRSLDSPPATSSFQVVDPFSFICFPVLTTPHQQLVATKRATSVFFSKINTLNLSRNRGTISKSADRKFRLGYLSADFHAHATSMLIADLIESHNRERVKVFAYSYGPDDASSTRTRMIDAFDTFRDIRSLSHLHAAEQIARDEIDILIDLKGYTFQARPDILAMRPAPIQVNFLGYPGTMAVDFVDYVIADAVILPFDQQANFVEKIIHVPGCYQPNDRKADIATNLPTRTDCGLPEDAVVLCCFNNAYKITAEIMDSWARILHRVPKSVLWLLAWNEWIENNLRREASKRGIPQDRIIFSDIVPNREHLARERLADIFVDTFPVVAHTTASDALRVGVPVVTIMGESMITRVAGSLLHAVGLEELIARDYATYESIILGLANDPERRLAIRNQLLEHAKHGDLFDGKIFARKLETVFESIWQRFEMQNSTGAMANKLSPEAYYNRGNAFIRNRDYQAAREAYEQALWLRPDFPSAVRNLTNTYVMLGTEANERRKPFEAIPLFEAAIRLRPDFATAYHMLGAVYQRIGQAKEAVDAYRLAYDLGASFNPIGLVNQLQGLCEWSKIEELTQKIVEVVDAEVPSNDPVRPFAFLTLLHPSLPSQQLRCAQRWCQQYKSIPKMEPAIDPAQRAHHRQLRIGYVSADFRDHATTWLITEMLESHNRNAFEIFGYACSPGDGSLSHQRIRQSFDHFREVWKLSDSQLATQIRVDEIDILIDLKGFTAEGRPEVFAHRPSPIQVSFLGFPGTTGADYFDYLIADHFVIPTSQQAYYSESIAYMPGCYQPNDRRMQIAATCPSRKSLGLSEGSFVFGSFNNSYKHSPSMMSIWMRLLNSVPDSVLWLLEFNPSMVENLRHFAKQHDVDPARLVFAPQLPHDQHLARHQAMDLFLDTFPVCAHTTASDTLRMGVPLVTLVGESFVSRVAGSLLNTLKLEELIAYSYQEYEDIAKRLAQNPDELQACRTKLQRELAVSACFDGKIYARGIESAYAQMWRNWLHGEKPKTFSVRDSQ
jgi:protein O-GlcNAc transferase